MYWNEFDYDVLKLDKKKKNSKRNPILISTAIACFEAPFLF